MATATKHPAQKRPPRFIQSAFQIPFGTWLSSGQSTAETQFGLESVDVLRLVQLPYLRLFNLSISINFLRLRCESAINFAWERVTMTKKYGKCFFSPMFLNMLFIFSAWYATLGPTKPHLPSCMSKTQCSCLDSIAEISPLPECQVHVLNAAEEQFENGTLSSVHSPHDIQLYWLIVWLIDWLIEILTMAGSYIGKSSGFLNAAL